MVVYATAATGTPFLLYETLYVVDGVNPLKIIVPSVAPQVVGFVQDDTTKFGDWITIIVWVVLLVQPFISV